MPKQNLPADLMGELRKERPDFDNCRSIIEWDSNAINYKDPDGVTPLMEAARFNYLDIVELLVKKGADVNAADDKGSTALHYAVYGRRLAERTIRHLCQNGADINAPNGTGSTPLHAAVGHNNLPALKLLVSMGADTEALDVNMGTPADFARRVHSDPAYLMALTPGSEPLSLKELADMKAALSAAFHGAVLRGTNAETLAQAAQALLEVDMRLRDFAKGPRP